MSEACREVGVGDTAMRRWVKQLRSKRLGAVPRGPALSAEQRRIHKLEAQVQRLEQQKAV